MKTIFFSLVLLLTLSCTDNNDNNDFQPQTITPVLIGKGDLSGVGAEGIVQQTIVVSDQASWTNLINSMNKRSDITKNFTSTTIDFDKYQIIAVFDNIKTTGGFSIDITNIVENQNNIVVTIKNLLTGGDSTVMTQPFHIVKMPKSTKPVVFQ
jgi:hypothetical protein